MIDTNILQSLLGAAGGAAAIVLTAWFALRRFRSEKWWERKAQTYATIFDAMNDLLEEVDLLTDEEITRNTVLSPQYKTKLAKAAGEARRQIRKASRIGSFLLSEKSESILIVLLKNLERARTEKTYFEHLDANWGALTDALSELKREARSDLRIESFLIRIWRQISGQ